MYAFPSLYAVGNHQFNLTSTGILPAPALKTNSGSQQPHFHSQNYHHSQHHQLQPIQSASSKDRLNNKNEEEDHHQHAPTQQQHERESDECMNPQSLTNPTLSPEIQSHSPSSETKTSENPSNQLVAMVTHESHHHQHDHTNKSIITNNNNNIKPYKCQICRKAFARRSTFNTHERTQDSEKHFCCTFCAKAFPKRDRLRSHELTHTGLRPFVCPDCPRSFGQRTSLDNHRRTHSGERPYRCPYCTKSFAQRANLDNHKRTHTGERPFGCFFCSKSFSQRATLINHERTHFTNKFNPGNMNNNNNNNNITAYNDRCNVNSNNYKTSNNARTTTITTATTTTTTTPTNCVFPGPDMVVFPPRPGLINVNNNNSTNGSGGGGGGNDTSSEQRFPTSPAPSTRHNPCISNKNYNISYQSTSSQPDTSRCLTPSPETGCPSELPHKDINKNRCTVERENVAVKKHALNEDDGKPSNRKDDKLNDEEGSGLEELGSESTPSAQFGFCTSSSPYTGYYSHSSQHLVASLNVVDSLEQRIHARSLRTFDCSICSKVFSQKASLDNHLRTHTGVKPFTCNFCCKSFTQRASLDNHRRIHTGEKPFHCEICQRAFSQRATLKNHVRTHANSTVKAFNKHAAAKEASDRSESEPTHDDVGANGDGTSNSTSTGNRNGSRVISDVLVPQDMLSKGGRRNKASLSNPHYYQQQQQHLHHNKSSQHQQHHSHHQSHTHQPSIEGHHHHHQHQHQNGSHRHPHSTSSHKAHELKPSTLKQQSSSIISKWVTSTCLQHRASQIPENSFGWSSSVAATVPSSTSSSSSSSLVPRWSSSWIDSSSSFLPYPMPQSKRDLC